MSNLLVVGNLYMFKSPVMKYGQFYLDIDSSMFMSKMIKIYNGSILLFLEYTPENVTYGSGVKIKFLYDNKILYTRIVNTVQEKYFIPV